MSVLKKIRRVFQFIADPFINLLVKLRISPNMVTTSAFFFVAFTVYFIIQKNTLAIGVTLAVTALVDLIDGAVAKKVGSTRFGDFYDAVIDRLIEGIVYIAIAYSYPEYYLICFIALIFSYMTSYVAARAEVWTIGVKIKYLGVGSRSGRLTVLVLAFMLDKLEMGLYLIIFLAVVTSISRGVVTARILRNKKK